jgi:hemerythrin-like domain-containing protein
MLTATYSRVAIAAEQDKAHTILSRLQQHLQSAWQGLQSIDFAFLESAFNKMRHFDEYCRARKVELYLIPAVRRATTEADALIGELEALSAAGGGMLRSLREQLVHAFDFKDGMLDEIRQSMQRYCDNMRLRLKKEDAELFPLARRVFSMEEWFSVAAQFLSDEAQAGVRKRRAIPVRRTTAVPGMRAH